MSTIEKVKVNILSGKINECTKAELYTAYLQLHINNPGLHPDSSQSADGGYLNWERKLCTEVLSVKIESYLEYPCWHFGLGYKLSDLKSYLDKRAVNYRSLLATSVDMEMFDKITEIEKELRNLRVSRLKSLIKKLETVQKYFYDEHCEENNEGLVPLTAAIDCFEYIIASK